MFKSKSGYIHFVYLFDEMIYLQVEKGIYKS